LKKNFGTSAGAILWNLLTREAERFGSNETSPVVCVCWHHDGRQLMCGHADGSLTIWNLKKPGEVIHKTIPHSPSDSDVQCRPITHLVWSTNVDNEQLIIFSGGMPADDGVLPSLTILRAKGSLTVLEMDYSIVEVIISKNRK
jgi:syntaxin-binding protein 5